jgi:hypothetical protein
MRIPAEPVMEMNKYAFIQVASTYPLSLEERGGLSVSLREGISASRSGVALGSWLEERDCTR